MVIKTVLLGSLLVGCTLSANPLPSYMEGTFVLKSSNGFDAYMSALGVGFLTRTVSSETQNDIS